MHKKPTSTDVGFLFITFLTINLHNVIIHDMFNKVIHKINV